MGFHPLVDHERRQIIFWNAKCGCSSVKDMFLRLVRGSDYAGFRSISALHVEVGYRNGPYACAEEDVSGPLADYFKWIVVRNPWRRLSSFFGDKSVGGEVSEVDKAKAWDSRGLTFRQLVERVASLPAGELQHHLEPQALGIEDIEFDEVVKLEQSSAAITEIGVRVGITDLVLPRIHVARNGPAAAGTKFLGDEPATSFVDRPTPHWRQLYDDELVEMVGQVYAADTERFGYCFESPA